MLERMYSPRMKVCARCKTQLSTTKYCFGCRPLAYKELQRRIDREREATGRSKRRYLEDERVRSRARARAQRERQAICRWEDDGGAPMRPLVEETPLLRRCSTCGNDLPIGRFLKKGSGRLRSNCSVCDEPRRIRYRAVRRRREVAAQRERITAADLRRMGDRQGWKCGCGCGRDIRYEYEVDHIQALARGGEHTLKNLQLMAPICNRRKGAR